MDLPQGQFAAGRAVRQRARQLQQLSQSQDMQPLDAYYVLAVHKQTKKQTMVGFAMTRRGVAELVTLRSSEFPEHEFMDIRTVAVLR